MQFLNISEQVKFKVLYVAYISRALDIFRVHIGM